MSTPTQGSVSAEVALRSLVPGDLAFVYSTWLRDLRAEDFSPLPDDLWFSAHREAITRLLADPAVRAVVATPTDDSDDILGYAVATPGVALHWVCIRKNFRGQHTGLVGKLLGAAGADAGVPASWRHPSGRALHNPPRPRSARIHYALPADREKIRLKTEQRVARR